MPNSILTSKNLLKIQMQDVKILNRKSKLLIVVILIKIVILKSLLRNAGHRKITLKRLKMKSKNCNKVSVKKRLKPKNLVIMQKNNKSKSFKKIILSLILKHLSILLKLPLLILKLLLLIIKLLLLLLKLPQIILKLLLNKLLKISIKLLKISIKQLKILIKQHKILIIPQNKMSN